MVVKTHFLSSLFPEELNAEIVSKSRGPIANANNNFQWGLYNGLRNFFPELYLINLPNIGAYPIRYTKVSCPGAIIKKDSLIIGESIPFINLLFFKHYFKYLKVLGKIEKIIQNGMQDKHIFFTYDLYPPFLKALLKCKKKYPDVKIFICLIVPDLHGNTGGREGFISKVILKKESKDILNAYAGIDSFVFLSKYMADVIPVNIKPWVVVEGIFEGRTNNIEYQKTPEKNCTLFYSGALDERNGVLNLLQAFSLIKDDRYRLVICGDGELRTTILDQARNDSRIIYMGQIARDLVIELQQKATLLINPRIPDHEFTQYSFPSKTMEYLASGTPTLMYVLKGVPEEYYNYCFSLQDSSIEILKDKIVEICNMENKCRIERGREAKLFILNNKLPKSQCELIFNMIEKVGFLNENID